MNIATSEADSLKSEIIDKDSTIQGFNDRFRRMMKDIDRLKEKKSNSDEAKKMKKTKDELKQTNKKLEETIKAKETLNVKFGQEVSARAHAEKEVVRLTQCQDALQLIIEKGKPNEKETRQNGATNKSNKTGIECKDFNKPAGCSYGDRCKFEHIRRNGLENKRDCSHWMEGECSFTDKACKYAHEQAKKGSKMKSNQTFLYQGNQSQHPSQGLENQSVQDQVKYHVKMMMNQQGSSNPSFPTYQLAGSASQ